MTDLLRGDVILKLKEIPDETISCVMTSPPYWSQRDYKVSGQIGLEKTYQEWLAKLWAVMDEIWRVLRKDGTVFVNLGDKYSNSSQPGGGDPTIGKRNLGDSKYPKMPMSGIQEKSLLLLPERFVIGCLERGWIIRNKIVWHKPNPMPCSAKDRFTNTWEHLFFMVKSRKYWFDLDAVRRPHKISSEGYVDYDKAIGKSWHNHQEDLTEGQSQKHLRCQHPAGANPGDVLKEIKSEIDEVISVLSQMTSDEIKILKDWLLGLLPITDPTDFWKIATQPSKLAHYATFPEALVRTPLKAGCPRWICKECGMARVRITKPSKEYQEKLKNAKIYGDIKEGYKIKTGKDLTAEYHTIGWSFCSCLCPACGKADCKCGAKWRAGIMLDPFCGVGTALKVAKRLGLDYIGIDIKPEYIEMSRKGLKETFYQEVLI